MKLKNKTKRERTKEEKRKMAYQIVGWRSTIPVLRAVGCRVGDVAHTNQFAVVDPLDRVDVRPVHAYCECGVVRVSGDVLGIGDESVLSCSTSTIPHEAANTFLVKEAGNK